MSGREIVHAPCIHHAHTVFERRTNRGSSRVPRRCLATPLNSQLQGYSRPVSPQRNHIRRERVAADDRSARHVGADPAQIQGRPADSLIDHPRRGTMRADAMFAGSTNASILTRRALNSDRKCRAARSPRFLGSETEVDPHMASG
jgi:hypothetical protein